jgi:nucleotide-binding universal stress UspA family protein
MWPSDCKHVEHAANFTNTHPGRLLGTLFSDDPIRERIRTALQRRYPIASRCESCLFRSRNGNFRVGHTSGARVDSFNTNQENGGIRRFGTARFQVRRLVYEGDPEAQIVATAEAETVQLVIMPTHGYGVFRRFLLGSVTSKVLHDLSCPMLTGAHLAEQGGTGKIAISNIVCAIDRGVESRDTLEWASKLAADFQAALSVVHAVPHVNPSLGVSSDSKAQMEAMVRETIGELQGAATAKSVTVCIQEGEVAHAVCGYAKSVGAHLLVIGRGKDRHMGRLRTNAYGIIRQSPCPVLSV